MEELKEQLGIVNQDLVPYLAANPEAVEEHKIEV